MRPTLVMLTVLLTSLVFVGKGVSNEKEGDMKELKYEVNIQIGEEMFEAELWDNSTAKSLVDQMPFSVELKDYHAIEKIFHPEQPLSKEGAPKGYDPKIGDITCYGPWGNVAIFYKDFDYADGLIPVGRIPQIQEMIVALESSNEVTFRIKKQ